MSEKDKEFKIFREKIKQPIDHDNPDGDYFYQYIDILIPNGIEDDAPVFFHLGNEQALNDEKLILWYETYGKRNDIIYIQAEHRGYGQSISFDKDQTVPSYVKIRQALADYHEVIESLKERFNGPWIGVGYSYGGGLVINFAADYPNDVNVILSSSGVVDWPFIMDTYDHQARINLGEKLYNGLARHINNLKPRKLFDDNWLEREFLIAACHGLAQRAELKRFRKTLLNFIDSSTEDLLKMLHRIDKEAADEEGWRYALSNGKLTLTREEALTEKYTWRYWRYQQCFETGVFEISEKPNGIFPRTRKDFIEESIALFGQEPPVSKNPSWSPRSMVKQLKIPLIYVNGGRDPWKGLCLEQYYPIENGKYFYYPEGMHCPEKEKLRRGKEVLDCILKFAQK